MEYDKYIAGVGPDGITDEYELKVLICYVMKSVGEPLQKEQISEVFQLNSLTNFFEFSSCFDDLLKSGHIEFLKKSNELNYYKITLLGSKTADVLEKILPLSVRDIAVKSALDLLLKARNQAASDVIITTKDDKFIVNCKVTDFTGDLVEINLLVPDKSQAELVKKNFLNNSESVYSGLLALLTGDKATFKRLFNN